MTSIVRPALLLVLSILAAASPAAAQSCATLGGQLDCRAAPSRPPAKSPQSPRAGHDVEFQGSAEATVSNRGVSTTLDSRVIDSHGIVEFGYSGSTGSPCRVGPYRAPCD